MFNEWGAPHVYVSAATLSGISIMSALARASLYIGVLLLTKAPSTYAQSHTSTLGADRSRAIHLLQRATYGPRPQDIEALLVTGVAGWPECA